MLLEQFAEYRVKQTVQYGLQVLRVK